MSDRTKKLNTAMYVGIALLFVTIIALLSVAIVKTPDDKLLEVCWQPDGQAQYVDSSTMSPEEMSCTEPESIKWHSDHLAIAVINPQGLVVSALDTPRSLVYAVESVNRQLDTNLSFTDSLSQADIVVDWRAAYDSSVMHGDSAGYCQHRRLPNGRLAASMAVRGVGSNSLESRVAVHELGHCIGLAHSPFGIMYRTVDDGDMFVLFSDSQKQMISEMY